MLADAARHVSVEAIVASNTSSIPKRSEYAPPPLLKRMVASGRLGKKSGRGFYSYSRAREEVAA